MEGIATKMVRAIVHAASLVIVARFSMSRSVLFAVPILLRSVKTVLVARIMVNVVVSYATLEPPAQISTSLIAVRARQVAPQEACKAGHLLESSLVGL